MLTRGTAVTNLGGFLLGLALACGVSRVAAAADSPKPITKEELPAAKTRLTELETKIAQKEKELQVIKLEADAQRKRIAAAKEPEGKVYRSAEELLVGIPKDAYPVFGPNGSIERAAARKWLLEKLGPGQNFIEWEATVKDVVDQGRDPFTVALVFDSPLVQLVSDTAQPSLSYWAISESILLGDQSCQLLVRHSPSARYSNSLAVDYINCTADEVKTLRELKGKKVSFRGEVQKLDVSNTEFIVAKQRVNTVKKEVGIILSLDKIAVNVFLPAASKDKSKAKSAGFGAFSR